MVLSEVANAQPRVLSYQATGWLKLTGQQLQNRGLTGSVRADDPYPGIELNIEVDMLKKRLIFCVPKGHVGHLNNRWRKFLYFGEFEVHSILSLWRLQDRHSLEFLDPRLRFL